MFRAIVIVASAATAISVTALAAQALPSGAADFSSARATQKTTAAADAFAQGHKANKNFGGGGGNKGAGGGARNFGGNAGGNKNFGGNRNFGGNKNVGSGGNKNFGGNNAPKFNANNNPNFKGKQNFQGGNAVKFGGNNNFKFKAGPGQINKVAFKPAPHMQFVKLGKFNAPLWKSGPKKIWWGNKWKVFVPLTALGVVALRGAYYYPDAYLTVARPVCTGITPDGCRLNWQRVDFEDGEGDWQCVQYCRRPGEAPPPRTVSLVAPPPLPQGGACELSIFSEPNFGGTNATANGEQPRLGEIGWQNQIASVKVAAGTWDFFSDPEFTGETMRLQPGDYGDLGAEWSKKAGSFMCVQP